MISNINFNGCRLNLVFILMLTGQGLREADGSASEARAIRPEAVSCRLAVWAPAILAEGDRNWRVLSPWIK
jgi:hypothetical protein